MEPALFVPTTAVLSTTAMTAFSYVASYALNMNFREPDMLAHLLKGKSRKNPGGTRVSGWFVHYGVGAAFIIAYYFLWNEDAVPATYSMGAVIGLVSGILAVAVWATTLNLHPNPPVLNRQFFYIQLVPAHIVFALIATFGYRYAA